MNRLIPLAVLVLLTACARVPDSGPIVEVDAQVTGVGTEPFVRALARPPAPGMTPMEIVQGFLDAASGFEDDHAVARQYLTAPAAASWQPDTSVRVYGNGTQTLSEASSGAVELRAEQVGSVDAQQQYVPAPPRTALAEQFGLEQVGGQWRISRLAPGLLLSRAAAERSYRPFQTFYVARPGGILTPNPVLFTSAVRDVPRALVEALVRGPSQWLSPAVINAFPVGTTLRSFSVTDGIARVDLSAPAGAADDLSRQQMSAQLTWTLRQISGIQGTLITVDGQPLSVPGQPQIQPRTAWADYDPAGFPIDGNWYFVRQGAVLGVNAAGVPVRVPGAAGQSVPATADPLIGLDLLAVAATDNLGQTVTSSLEQNTQWSPARTSAVTRGGSWDRTGLLWLPNGQDGAQTVNPLGSLKVDVARTPVSSVQISRDGTRALVVAGPPRRARAYLMRVDRATGSIRLVRPRIIATDPVRAAAWENADRVALLVKPEGQPAQIATVELALYGVRLLGGPPRAETVAAAPNRPLLSGTADGRIWGFNGSTWVSQTTGQQPRYPG